MALATWWTVDDMPMLPALPGLSVTGEIADDTLARLNRISVDEVRARRAAGHRPYVAEMDGAPVAYGWVATQSADIGELNLRFQLPAGDRYLWDFATEPTWQGHGIYPRLLQWIVLAECADAARFWILSAPENLPSGAGMEKAGFLSVGQLSFLPDGRVAMVPLVMAERGRAGADVLGVPLAAENVNPCWRCVEKLVCNCMAAPDQCSCTTPVRRGAERGADRARGSGTVTVDSIVRG